MAGTGSLQDVDHAEVDAARAHHFVAKMRDQVGEGAGMRDRDDAFARSQGEPLDNGPRHGGVVERQLWLRDERGGGRDRGGDEQDDVRLNDISLSLRHGFRESIEFERPQIELRIAAGDHVGEDPSGGG